MTGCKRAIAGAALGVAGCAAPAAAPVAGLDAQALPVRDYHAFVANWSPADKPLCAVLRSGDEWRAVVHPAPVMFGANVFGPPDAFWAGHAVLLIARQVQGGSDAFKSYSVHATPLGIEVDYAMAPAGGGSFTTKAYLALAVAKPVAGRIVFADSAGVACRLDPAGGVWVSPALTAPPGGAAR
jgi:hypothetical protein